MATVAVVGGGAAGMMAAVTAADEGAKVTVFEHNDRVGRKILMTGNGKCNLSNLFLSCKDYYGGNSLLIKEVLSRFTVRETIDFFRGLGLLVKDKNGYLYPMSEQASAVLDVLRLELCKKNIKVVTDANIRISREGKGFAVCDRDRAGYYDNVILACGSRANPQTGSDGSGYQLAEQFGHHLIKPLPALTALRCPESYFKAVAGVRCEADLQLLADESVIAQERGELQMTEYGISGIPVFQFSRMASKALDAGKMVTVLIDFLPLLSRDDLFDFLSGLCGQKKNRMSPVTEVFTGILHKKLLQMILKQKKMKGTEAAGSLSEEQILQLSTAVKAWEVTIKETNPFQNAQVCCGGVDCSEITGNLESKKFPGLFFAGEILDVDGRCGGYNLQWAWSSGYVAGKSAAASRESKGR